MGSIIQIPLETDDDLIWGQRAEKIIKEYRNQLDKMSRHERHEFIEQKIKDLYPDG